MERKHRKRTILPAAILALLLALICLVRLGLTSRRLVSRLPNGTDLCLLAVTHGPSNIFFPGGFRDELIYRFLPAQGITIGSLRLRPVTPVTYNPRRKDGSPAFTNNLVLWTGLMQKSGSSNSTGHDWDDFRHPIPGMESSFDNLRATLTDEKGMEWDTDPRTFHMPTGTPWNFPAYPRRAQTLRFTIYQYNDLGVRNTLASFSFANPRPGPYPVWKPSPLPITKNDGNLQVSLVSLVNGSKIIPYYKGIRPFTRATFEVKEDGQSSARLPDRVTSIDATGNEPPLFETYSGATNGLVYYEMQGIGLSPTEVWRLRVRVPGRAFPLWTSPEISVSANSLVPMKLTTNIQSFSVSLASKQNQSPDEIVLSVSGLPDAAKLACEIVDDQGRPAKYRSGYFEDSGFDASWYIPHKAKWLKVHVSLCETHIFEFLAQPTTLP